MKGHIIRNIRAVVWTHDFWFLRNTGTDKSQFICNIHVFFHINCRTHHGTVHRNYSGNQIRYIFLDIVHNCGTGLWNSSGKILFCNIIQISPGGNIRPETHTDYMFCPKAFQISKHFSILSGIICYKRRRHQKADGLSLLQILQKLFRIIPKIPCMMVTGINTRTAMDTGVSVDINQIFSVFGQRIIRLKNRTDRNTVITSNAFFIGINQPWIQLTYFHDTNPPYHSLFYTFPAHCTNLS